MSHPPLTPVGSALAGALGAVFSNAVVYPLDTVKTRMQALTSPSTLPTVNAPTSASAQKEKGKEKHERLISQLSKLPKRTLARVKRWEMLNMLVKIIRTEGLSGAFKGFAANMINTFSMQFAYFFFHTLLRNATLRHDTSRSSPPSPFPSSLSTSSELLLGAAAGGLAQIFTIPVSVIATRQQLWDPLSDHHPSFPTSSTSSNALPTSYTGKITAPSLWETAREIISESGPRGLWTGLKPGLVLTVNPAITYGAFERLKSAVLARPGRANTKLGIAESFWLGVCSKAIATIVTYPYIFAKVRLQARRDDKPPRSSLDSACPSYATIASQPPSVSSSVVSEPGEANPDINTETNTDTGPKSDLEAQPVPPRRPTPRGAIPLLMAVYREKGLAGWYQGLAAQLIKAVLCQGILFVSKDQFETWAWLIIALLTRIRKRVSIQRAALK